MTSSTQCDFFLLRYVPDAVKNEFVNIGLVLRSPSGAEIRFTRDYSRVRNLDPDADLELLASLESELRTWLADASEPGAKMFMKLEDSLSNTIQLSPVKGLHAEDVKVEADKLAAIFLETARVLKGAHPQRGSLRLGIRARMSSAFEQAGVWPLMTHDIAAKDYTHPGDPLKIDCGYKYKNGGGNGNGERSRMKPDHVKLFHALAIESSVEPAKSLAFTWPALRRGIAEKMELHAAMTAIINPALDSKDERVAYSFAALEGTGILVATLDEMPAIAETARGDLGL